MQVLEAIRARPWRIAFAALALGLLVASAAWMLTPNRELADAEGITTGIAPDSMSGKPLPPWND
jgi:hypothetical protein